MAQIRSSTHWPGHAGRSGRDLTWLGILLSLTSALLMIALIWLIVT